MTGGRNLWLNFSLVFSLKYGLPKYNVTFLHFSFMLDW